MLRIHRADRADRLVEALGGVLAEPLDDPMQREVVSVPSRGVERWISQQLATQLGASPGRADGVCANIDFPFPGSMVGDAVAAAAGLDGPTDPWRPERAVWPLLEVVDGCLNEPWLARLAAHLGSGGAEPNPVRRARRFATVRHLADLYDRYAVHRPELLIAWATNAGNSGGDGPAPGEDERWQAELWRRLRQRIGQASPAERLAAACDRIRADASLVDLPVRLALFGLTRLPAAHLEVLRALSAARDVHLFLLHPSPALWDTLAPGIAAGPRFPQRLRDETARSVYNPLLAAWGLDAREMQLVIGPLEGAADTHVPLPPAEPTTLLERLQADVRANRPPPGLPSPGEPDARPFLNPGDRSVQIHACHGRSRQVEVVRDSILHALADDPSLEPRDIVVMCPDIETFAPLILATFGAAEPLDGDEEDPARAASGLPDLHVRLADRSLRQTNPMLSVVSTLLTLPQARVTASEVLDLAGREPCRRRFHFDDDELTRLQEWVRDTYTRWGFDGAHRAPYQLDGLEGNTWRAGLDRVLLGVTMADEDQRQVGGAVPLDDVESDAIDLAGRFAEFVDRLQAATDALSRPQVVSAWTRALGEAADALTAVRPAEAWQRAQLQRVLDEIVTEATADGAVSETPLDLPELRALLADRLRGRPTRANFRTGHLTICTMVPMRSVPHRVVCLLGIDDGAFPRAAVRDGDDLILAEPHIGDRDARNEDHQLLLDALLAATQTLIVTYSGRDERNNAELPPAVPVAELLDALDSTAQAGSEHAPRAARDQVLVAHPLQTFDPRNFTPGALLPEQSWSYDAVALDGARAFSAHPRQPAPPFLREPLPRTDPEAVELERLVRFVQHPVKSFLLRRLGVSLSSWSEDVEDDLPVELEPLEAWGVGDRLLAARLAGCDAQAFVAAERARGALPPGALATPFLDEVVPVVEELVACAQSLGSPGVTPESVDVRLRLSGGRLLTGTVPGVSGNLARTVVFSRVSPKHRLAAWVRHLVLTVACPDLAIETATVGRGQAGAKQAHVVLARIGPLAADPARRRTMALAHLAALVDLYDRGLREPLPLYCGTSAAYVSAVVAGHDPAKDARAAWESSFDFSREDKDPQHELVLGAGRTIEDLLAEPCRDDEDGEGWAMDDSTRLGRLAHRLWDGLLACETLESR